MIARMATTPITFFGEVRDELKKVVWPTRQETIRLTLVVITVSLLVGLFLGGLDFIFVKLIGIIVK
jgi:preprotein translocase subunit SecE